MSNTINIDGTEYVRADTIQAPDYSGSPSLACDENGWDL